MHSKPPGGLVPRLGPSSASARTAARGPRPRRSRRRQLERLHPSQPHFQRRQLRADAGNTRTTPCAHRPPWRPA